MAHNIQEHDSMVSVGERPWHGLGTTIQGTVTGKEALTMAKMDWTVERKPLVLKEDGRPAVLTGSVSRSNDGQYAANVRSDTKEILGIVGPAYVPYQNHQMGELFDDLVSQGKLKIETVGSLYNGRRVWMLGRFVGGSQEVEKGDAVRLYMLLAHGHDGQFAVRMGGTNIRVVCWNTLSAAVTGEASTLVKCLHTRNLQQNLETLAKAYSAVADRFELSMENYRSLAMKGVSRAELREYSRIVVGAPKDEADRTHVQRKKMGQIVGAAMEGRGNSGRNFWHAYSGVTEYLTWQAGKTADTRLDNLWFGDSVAINKHALEVALQMSA